MKTANYINYLALADCFFRENHAEKFESIMEQLEGVANDNLNTPLSDRERRIVDAIVTPEDFQNYKISSESHIRKASAADPYIRNLFERDPRYSYILAETK